MVRYEQVQSLRNSYHDLYYSYFGKVRLQRSSHLLINNAAPNTAVAAKANNLFIQDLLYSKIR